jgi:hypothetical protein
MQNYFSKEVDTKMLLKVRLAALQSLILKWSTALAPSAPSPSLPRQNKKAYQFNLKILT